jgi:Uncharacterized protein conserved in cyanobacteria
MSLPKEKLVTIDEFYKIKESTDKILEFVDGVIYMAPSPSTKHQRISGRLYALALFWSTYISMHLSQFRELRCSLHNCLTCL